VLLEKHGGYGFFVTLGWCHHLDVLELVEIIEHHLVIVGGSNQVIVRGFVVTL